MAYMVVYRREDGTLSVETCADLNAAVIAAERLRNADAVQRPRIFKTTEVHYDFEPYYRVHVIDAPAPASASAGATFMGDAVTETPVAESSSTETSFTDASFTDTPVVEDAVVEDERIIDEVVTADPPPPAPEAEATSSAYVAQTEDEYEATGVDEAAETEFPQVRTGGLFSDFNPSGSPESALPDTDLADTGTAPDLSANPGLTTPADVSADAMAVADTPEVVVPDGPETIEIYDAEYELDPAAVSTDGGPEPASIARPETETGIGVDGNIDVADDFGAETSPPAPAAKTGLFEKFVSSLEGGGTAATGAADDVVEDISDGGNSKRGLFGR